MYEVFTGVHLFTSGSEVTEPMTKVIKGASFKWTAKAQSALKEIKNKLTQAPVLALPRFGKIFEVECDASSVAISGTPKKAGHLQ